MKLPASDVRSAVRLAFDAAEAVTDVVERMHGTIARRPLPFGRVSSDATRGLTRFVYGCVRGGLRLGAHGLDLALAATTRPAPEAEPPADPRRDAVVAALNGVWGDHLARSGNALAFDMDVRLHGRRVDPVDVARAFPAGTAPTGRVLLLVHGLCMNDRQWRRRGHDHGARLADDAGHTPLYLRYNTGLPIGTSGAQLAKLLERLIEGWPVPVEEVAIVGHSMGGLVARSACGHARRAGHGWLAKLARLVFLGTPHHGAPLERGGGWLERLLDASPYSAPIARVGKARSAGIRDLRDGRVDDEPEPLPGHVACYAIAGSLAARGGPLVDRLVGDGLVPVDGALGRHADARRALPIPAGRQWVAHRTGHLELLDSPEVYARLREWLAPPAARSRALQRRVRATTIRG